MGRLFTWKALVLSGVVSAFMVFGVSAALADDFHGIAFAKGCTSPVKVGDPYTCQVQILNVVDTAHDTLRVTGFSDVVHSAGGNVATGNILPTTGLVFSGGASCTGGSGAGTSGDPYIGATECLLPFNASITTKSFSHYTVQANDFNLPNHQLTDTATLNWNNTCTAPSPNCTTDPQEITAGSSAIVQLPSATATSIHNANHQVVTAVEIGSTVHDFVTVTGQANSPAPSGNVNIDWFLNGTCTGQPAANSGSIGPLDANGELDATGFAFTVNTAGARAFKAHYEGNSTYLPSDGACEPLAVVDANIQITPNGVNPIGKTHTFTAHVNVNDGNGSMNAPDGTQISFTIDSGPGGFVTTNPCTTAGGTGSCAIGLSSGITGSTIVSAHTTIAVDSVTLTRHTDGTGANSGPATKAWADSTARTDILNAQGTVILSAVAGTVVHDKVFVARAAGTPAGVPDPTGTVVFHRFATINCLGASVDQSVALSVGNPSTAVSDAFAVTADMSYQAEYKGDVNYPARTGACEPLTVTPVPAPAIAIVKNPKSQSLAVGGTATFTITVTNTGNVVLTDVHVVDPLSPNCNRTKAEIPALASMAPGAQVTYTCTRPNVRSAFDNVATAIGTPPTGPDVTASDTAPVTTKAPLTPKKVVKKKKKPKVVSHKKPKATG